MKKLLFTLATLLLTITACQAAPAEPVIVTVVQTQLVPATVMVEVTRIVEVVQTVEATRLVEVVVTATPAPTQPPTPTLTPIPLGGGSPAGGDNFTAPDNALPTEKVSGVSVLKVINETRETLVVSIQGDKTRLLQHLDNRIIQ
ncbi:MAG: hypothetical protein OHK0052_24830 [Anaerolineales bacterium]